MAKKPRIQFIPFGQDGPTDDFAVFGSKKEGTPTKTKDIAAIQGDEPWVQGLKDAILSSNRAAYLEDMNAIFLVMGYMLGYLFQEGIPEWDSATEYDIGSIVKKVGTTELYGSRINANTGNTLPSQQTNTQWEFLGTKLNGYRRPVLQWNGNDTVNIEAQSGLANTTQIMFPDGSVRTVTENLATTQKYRRFNKTLTAEFTAGTESSGMRSGLTAAANNIYPIYAVKSQIDETKFVLVGDNTEPVLANVATLNSRYTVNGWVYLGMVAMINYGLGDGLQIMGFKQWGSKTFLEWVNVTVPGPLLIPQDCALRMASVTLSTADTATDIFTPASGLNFGAGQIPLIFGMIQWRLQMAHTTPGAATVNWGNVGIVFNTPEASGGIIKYFKAMGIGEVISGTEFEIPPDRGFKVGRTAAGNWPETNGTVAADIKGWDDAVLKVGLNNLI